MKKTFRFQCPKCGENCLYQRVKVEVFLQGLDIFLDPRKGMIAEDITADYEIDWDSMEYAEFSCGSCHECIGDISALVNANAIIDENGNPVDETGEVKTADED